MDCTNEENNEVGAFFNQEQMYKVSPILKGKLKTSGFQIIPPSKHCSSLFHLLTLIKPCIIVLFPVTWPS